MEKEMVCLKCGDQGFSEALILCVKCKVNAEHFYCLDVLPKTFDLNVQWFCHECQPVVEQKKQTRHPRSSQKEVEVDWQWQEHSVDIDRGLVNEPDDDDECADKAENSKRKTSMDFDIAWIHAVKIKKPKWGLVCKYCSRAMVGRGSITRLKEHLAGGYDLKTIKACPNVPLDVKETMKKIMEDKERVKAKLIEKARANGLLIIDFSGRLKVRKDSAWDYAERIVGKVNAMVCKFCSQTISGGGITRFKHHLAEKCNEAPPEVQEEMRIVLITKDVVKAKLDAKVVKIRRKMQEQRSEREDNH